MKKICIGRRRVLDFASVLLSVYDEEFVDGNPTVQYQYIRELEGNELDYCHSDDDYVCRCYSDDDFDDVIPKTDFQDGISEYEDLAYQCHMPDDYDCQHGMDEDFQDGISKYEEVYEVVPYDYNCDVEEGVDCWQ